MPLAASVSGVVADPTGAVIPGATIHLSGAAGYTATADDAGHYSFTSIAPGSYSIHAEAPGFAASETKNITLNGNQRLILDLRLPLETQNQEVQVNAQQSEDESARNSGAILLKSNDLSLLSSDPATMLEQLQSMAGADGESPGQLYVDGFSNGKMPPRSAIREIRINNNPYSAQYDDFGFGRIEVFTKPGSDKLHGEFYANGSDASFDSRNPYSPLRQSFYSTVQDGNLGGPINKKTSYFLSLHNIDSQNSAIVNAVTLNADNQQTAFTDSVSNPSNNLTASVKIETQFSETNTLSGRFEYNRVSNTNTGVGQLLLASQGYNSGTNYSDLQLSDTQTFGAKFINELRFQYIRTRSDQTPVNTSPTLIVQGAFTGGGNNLGHTTDNQDQYELQNYSSLDHGNHFLRFGFRQRLNRDANSSTAGFNGEYIFSSLAAYQLTERGIAAGLSPAQIRASGGGASQFNITLGRPSVAVLVSDTGIYAEDSWKARPNLKIDYGLRFETQNHIADHADFAPRINISYGIHGTDKKPAVLTLSGGFGIFYDRLPSSNILQVNRQNGILQQQYVLNSPDTYPAVPPIDQLTNQTSSTTFQISPNYRSPYEMRATVSLNRNLGKYGNVTAGFVTTRGVHELLTRNINAPLPGTYNPADPTSGVRPLGGTQNVYEYDTQGVGRRNRVYVNGYLQAGQKFSLFGYYSVGESHSDTTGGFPSNQYDLSVDYGRTVRDIRQRLYTGTHFDFFHGIVGGPFLAVQTSAPFNIVVGQDLNGDSQFNDRPAFATDLTRPSVVVTKYGTFDTQPIPGQRIIPINYANGPGSVLLNMELAKSFQFGPEVKAEGDAPPAPKPGTKPPPPDHRYKMEAGAEIDNLLNHVNPAPPVGTLGSPLFGQSNALSQSFSNNSANRTINLYLTMQF
jgi:hypothetical protein